MKKPKIKPEVVWMPWYPGLGFMITSCAYSKRHCGTLYAARCETTWDELRKQGWRIVKVRISEVK